MLLDGIHVPLTTPFYADGRLNLRKLEYNVARYSRSPVAGLLVLGVNGEPRGLNDAETREVLRTAITEAAAEKVMLAGIARDSVMATLEIAEQAASLAYDAVVLGLPGLLAGTRQILTYFQVIADRAALPVVLASAPGQELTVEVVAELAGHPQILGLIEGSRRVAEIRAKTAMVRRAATVTTVFVAVTGRMQAKAGTAGNYIAAESLSGGTAVAAPGTGLKTRSRETGFQVLGGTTREMLDGLQAGAVGAVPRMAACAPQACYEVLAAWKDGDAALAEEKQLRLGEAAERIEQEFGVAGLKFACDLNGYFGGWPRLPLLLPGGGEKAEIERLMREMRN